MKFNILDLLLPRETKFYDYFNKQVLILLDGAKTFRDLVANLGKYNEETMKLKINEVKEHEIKGDGVEKKIIEELNLTFITPFDREDIHTMAITLDRALDILNSVSQKIEIYGIKEFPKYVLNYSEIIVEISQELVALIGDLKQKKNITNITKKMHSLENKADYLFHISMNDLFSGKYSPIEIIKYKEFYEHLEDVVDVIDYIGKCVRGIMVKQG